MNFMDKTLIFAATTAKHQILITLAIDNWVWLFSEIFVCLKSPLA